MVNTRDNVAVIGSVLAGAVTAVLLVVVIVWAVNAGGNRMRGDCEVAASDMGLSWSWTGTYGCMVEVDGQWVKLRDHLDNQSQGS